VGESRFCMKRAAERIQPPDFPYVLCMDDNVKWWWGVTLPNDENPLFGAQPSGTGMRHNVTLASMLMFWESFWDLDKFAGIGFPRWRPAQMDVTCAFSTCYLYSAIVLNLKATQGIDYNRHMLKWEDIDFQDRVQQAGGVFVRANRFVQFKVRLSGGCNSICALRSKDGRVAGEEGRRARSGGGSTGAPRSQSGRTHRTGEGQRPGGEEGRSARSSGGGADRRSDGKDANNRQGKEGTGTDFEVVATRTSGRRRGSIESDWASEEASEAAVVRQEEPTEVAPELLKFVQVVHGRARVVCPSCGWACDAVAAASECRRCGEPYNTGPAVREFGRFTLEDADVEATPRPPRKRPRVSDED